MTLPIFPPPALDKPTNFKKVSGHKIGDTLDEEIYNLAGFFECAPRAIVIAALYDFFRKHAATQAGIIEEAQEWLGVPLFDNQPTPDDEAAYVEFHKRLTKGVSRKRYVVLQPNGVNGPVNRKLTVRKAAG